MTDIQSNEVPFAVLEDEVIPPHVGLEVEIYKHDDPNTRLDIIPDRWDVSTLDEIRKPGGGTFSLWRNDPKLLENPAILDWRNIVRIKLNHETVGAFLIQNKEAEIVSRDEASGEIWKVTGEGLRSWFRDAVVLPYGGLKAKSAPQRVFSFASEQGAWYKPEEWIAPVKIQQHNLDPNPGPWGTAPSQWPDAPEAWWVWGQYNDGAAPAPGGYNFFRYEFDIAESVGTKNYSLFAAGDNQMIAYVDAQELITADENDSWTRTWRGDVELDPGHHVLAFRVLNTGTSPAALIAAFFRAGDAAAETAAELLTVTGDPGWLVNPYPDPAPGWTAGEIMLTLLAEADARGVQFPTFLTPTFDAEVDSAGQTWTRALDWNFGVGAEYYEVVERLEEAVCDLWIDPDLLTLNMYVQRGVDRTTQTRALTPIKFEVGRNILRAHEEGTSDIKNTLALGTTDGFFLQSDALTDSISKYGRVEGLLSTGLSPDVSGDVANAVFAQKAIPSMASTYEIIDTDDARPYVDFGTGDYVLAPNAADEPTPIRILSMSVAEDPKTGRPIYAMEFGTITDDVATRHERWLKTLSNASLGGTVVNAGGGGGSGSSANPGQATQDGPQGAQGPAGPAGMTYRGVWLDSIEYKALDSVAWEGSTWISNVSENTDSEPAEGNTDWTLLARSGEQGESAYEVAVAEGFVGDEDAWLASLVGPQGPAGPGVTYRGNWSDTAEYVAGDLVAHAGGFWIADGYNLDAEPGVAPVWDSYDTGGVPITLTPNIVYGTDGSGDQTQYGISQSSSAGAVAQRTAQSTLTALTTADGATGDSDEVLVNKGFLARFRGDSVTNVTLADAGSTATTATQDVVFFSGSTVATYTVTLPTGLTSFKRITMAFLAEVTALTLNPGAGNTVNVAPLSAPVNTVLAYEYDPALTKWILVSQYPVGAGGGGGVSYEAAWNPTTSYQTGDVVVADDGTGAATWLALTNVAPVGGISFVGATTAASGTTVANAQTLAAPAGTIIGDYQIVYLAGYNGYSPDMPGWTLLGRNTATSGSSIAVFGRVVPDLLAVTTTTAHVAEMFVYRNLNPASLAVLSAVVANSLVAPAVSTTKSLVMRFWTVQSAVPKPLTSPAGMSHFTAAYTSGNNVSGYVADEVPVAGIAAAKTPGNTSVASSSSLTLGFDPSTVFTPGTSWAKIGLLNPLAPSVKGVWNNAVAYIANDIVIRGGDTYVATVANTGNDPGAVGVTTNIGASTGTSATNSGSPSRQAFTAGSNVTVTELTVTTSSAWAVGAQVGLVPGSWNGVGTPPWLGSFTTTVVSAVGALTGVLNTPVPLAAGSTYQLVINQPSGSIAIFNSAATASGAVSAVTPVINYGTYGSGSMTTTLAGNYTLPFTLRGYTTNTSWALLADGVPDGGTEGYYLKWVSGKPVWAALSVVGDGGFRGAWSQSTAYNAGDTVSYNGVIYGTATALAAAAAAVTVTDDFSSTLNARYVPTNSGSMAYATSAGRLSCTNVGTAVTGASFGALLMDTTTNAHSIEISNYRTATSGYSAIWIAYQDATNWLHLRFDSGTSVTVGQSIAGVVTNLTSFSVTAWTGVAGGIKFKADINASKVLTIWVNGTVVYTTTLTNFLGTKVGVGDSFTGIATWDDLTAVGNPSGSFDPALWTPAYTDTYKGLWAAATTYAIGDTVDRAGFRYKAASASTGVDPTTPASYLAPGSQPSGTTAIGSGGTTTTHAVAFTPSVNMTITDLRYYYTTAGNGTIKVGIASALGANPNALTWMSSVSGQPTAAGANVAHLPTPVNLVAGTTYQFVMQGETTTNMNGYTASGSSAPTGLVGISGLSRQEATVPTGSWSSGGTTYIAKFDLLTATSAWTNTGIPTYKDPYKGVWASGTTYAIGDTVDRLGLRYVAALASTGTDPSIPAALTTLATQPSGSGATGSGGSVGWTLAESFTPSANMTVTDLRYYYGADGVGLAKVGLASALGATPNDITWISSVSTGTLLNGSNVAHLPAPVNLVAGTQYHLIVQNISGTNFQAYTSSGSSAPTGVTGMTALTSRSVTVPSSAWGSALTTFVLKFDLLSQAPAWVSQSIPVPVGLPTQTGYAGKFLKTDGTNPSWDSPPGYRGAWSASIAYIKNETVLADDGTGLATWVALGDLTPAAAVQFIGSKTIGFSGSTGVTMPTGSQAGDTVLLTCLSGSTPTTPAGYALLTSGNNFWVYSRVLTSGGDTVDLGAGTSLSWTLRTYRSAGTITAATGTSATIPAQTGITGVGVGLWGSYSAYSMTAPATCSNIVVVTGDYRTQVTADVPAVSGATAAVTALNPAGNAGDTWGFVKIAPSTSVPFVPGSNWAKVGATVGLPPTTSPVLTPTVLGSAQSATSSGTVTVPVGTTMVLAYVGGYGSTLPTAMTIGSQSMTFLDNIQTTYAGYDRCLGAFRLDAPTSTGAISYNTGMTNFNGVTFVFLGNTSSANLATVAKVAVNPSTGGNSTSLAVTLGASDVAFSAGTTHYSNAVTVNNGTLLQTATFAVGQNVFLSQATGTPTGFTYGGTSTGAQITVKVASAVATSQAGKFLGVDTDNVAKWLPPGGVVRTTLSLPAASGNGTATLAKGARIIKIQSSAPTRFRLYRSTAQRTADAGRVLGTDPVGDAVLLEMNFVTASTLWTNPLVHVANDDSTYYTITSATADITISWEATA